MFTQTYNRIFWGFLLVLLDFRIGLVDILPDFIGYIMIGSALTKLVDQHFYFGKAKLPVFALTFLSLGDLIQTPSTNLLERSLSLDNLPLMLIGQITLLFQLYLVFVICKAIYLVAEVSGFTELMTGVKYRWYYYLLSSIAMLVLTPFLFNLPQQAVAILIPLVFIGFITMLLILGVIRQAAKLLGEITLDTGNDM